MEFEEFLGIEGLGVAKITNKMKCRYVYNKVDEALSISFDFCIPTTIFHK